MLEKDIKVVNKMGLHARPAAMLVQTASRFNSSIKIFKDDFEVDSKSIMGVMTLAAGHGSVLKFSAEGPDENAALEAIERLFNKGFMED
jgi:phosphocarrier protein